MININKVVYTAISGDYDDYKKPNIPDADIQFFNEPTYYNHHDPCRRAKYCRVLVHKVLCTEYSMWIDGSIILNNTISMREFINKYLKYSDIAVLKHPIRNDWQEEIQACILLHKDLRQNLERQHAAYRPYSHIKGMSQTGIILRRHTKEIENFNNIWWHHIEMFSRRDQVSFPIAAHVAGIPVTYIEDRSFFTIGPHKKRKGE